jgi:hypothetical protein
MPLSMIVRFGIVESAQQIVRRDPTIQALRLTGDNLNVQTAVRQQERRIPPRVRANLVQQAPPLVTRYQSHAGGGKQEQRRARYISLRDHIQRMLKQRRKVIGSDTGRFIVKRRDSFTTTL